MPISSLAQSEPPQAKRTTSIVGIPDNRVPTSASIPAIVIGPRGLERDGLVGILNQNGYAILDSVEAVCDIRPGSLPALIILSEFGQEQIEAGLIPVVQSRFPAARIVALTDEADPSVPRYLLQMGTQACLNRSTRPIALIRSLNVVMGGNIVISTDAASHLTGGTGGNQPPPLMTFTTLAESSPATPSDLSHREIEVLICLSAGHSNKSIARELLISEATVKIHVKNVLRKINVSNRTQAAVWVSKHGAPKVGCRRNGRAA